MTDDRSKQPLDLSQLENLEYMGLRAFAAWCGTTPEHAATRSSWATRGARHTVDGWNRVARVFTDEINSLLQALEEAEKALQVMWETHDIGEDGEWIWEALEAVTAAIGRHRPRSGHTPIEELVKQAAARFAAMSPEEQKRHKDAQRDSWVRGEMGMGDEGTRVMKPEGQAACPTCGSTNPQNPQPLTWSNLHKPAFCPNPFHDHVRAISEHDPMDWSSFEVSPSETKLIRKIARRASKIFRKPGSVFRRDVEMDITACHANGCPLNLSRLLRANKLDFSHDVLGISRFINRETGKMPEGIFWPRHAMSKENDDG